MQSLGIPAIWGWLGLAMLLIALEVLVAPGSYLLWIGLAALAMAGVMAIVPLSTGMEVAAFGALALLCGMIGWRVYGARTKDDAARDLHDLGGSLIGGEYMLVQPIADGIGQARVGDSVWRVSGPDMPAGAKVRVKRIDGSTLVVEPVP